MLNNINNQTTTYFCKVYIMSKNCSALRQDNSVQISECPFREMYLVTKYSAVDEDPILILKSHGHIMMVMPCAFDSRSKPFLKFDYCMLSTTFVKEDRKQINFRLF